uniref:Uncharacterized protein n=1 Tax=Meloidogyne javanica TaxID=6303 RepID=A0A915LHR1_MELJA
MNNEDKNNKENLEENNENINKRSSTARRPNSPIRSSLRKPPFHLNSVRTPTRRRLSLNISNNNNSCSSSEKQTKITDFVSVRKSFSPPDSLKFGKMGEENDKQNGKLLESPKKRRLNSKTEKGKKRVKIDLNEGIASRRSLRLRHLYAQNTTI